MLGKIMGMGQKLKNVGGIASGDPFSLIEAGAKTRPNSPGGQLYGIGESVAKMIAGGAGGAAGAAGAGAASSMGPEKSSLPDITSMGGDVPLEAPPPFPGMPGAPVSSSTFQRRMNKTYLR